MPVPGLSLLGLKRIRGFVSILRYINPTIIIIMCQPTTLGAEEAGFYQSFSGLAIYYKNFYLSCYCSIFSQIFKQNPIHSQPVPKLFQTKTQGPCCKTFPQVLLKCPH